MEDYYDDNDFIEGDMMSDFDNPMDHDMIPMESEGGFDLDALDMAIAMGYAEMMQDARYTEELQTLEGISDDDETTHRKAEAISLKQGRVYKFNPPAFEQHVLSKLNK